MKWVISAMLVVACVPGAMTQVRQWEFKDDPLQVHGVSVYGGTSEEHVPVIVRDTVYRRGKPHATSGFITIQFDVTSVSPPLLKIYFLHCDRDWVPENNVFIQDDIWNKTFYLNYKVAPNGVRTYTHRFVNTFPDSTVRFNYSGNWIFRLMSADGMKRYAEGRFFIVDNSVRTLVEVENGYLTEQASPLNQVQHVRTRVALPSEIDGQYFTTVDIYQNRRFFQQFRIDMNDRNPYTIVEGYGSGARAFEIRNIHPGNEYRTLDLSNTTRYPGGLPVHPVEGVDQHRRFMRAGPDRNGIALANKFTGIHSDYLDVVFRLSLTPEDLSKATRHGREVFLAGAFNGWNPTIEDRLVPESPDRLLVVWKRLRRGVYDYQYLTGRWDEKDWCVRDQDWLELEGNDWRTSNIYTAMVYFRDPRFGGFDRIVGYATAESPPGIPGSR